MPKKHPKRAVRTRKRPGNEPAFSEDGVDLTLIRWMLSLTPTERLEALQDVLWSIARLRGEDTED
jgi:hypothetical protein